MSQFRIRWSRYRPFSFVGTHVPCSLCGSEDLSVVRKRDRWFNRLRNVLCRRCGLIFLNPMPSDQEVQDFYRHHFWRRSQGAFLPTAKRLRRDRRSAQDRMQLLTPMLKPGMRILDIGSGSGEFLAAAKSAGYEVEGVEPSLEYARYSEREHGVTVHAEPLAGVDFGTRRFDLITSNHAFEHMRDPLGSFRRCHELLRPSGYLNIAVPDLAESGTWPLRFYQFAHLYGFTHQSLVMMAAKAGFGPPVDGQRQGTMLTFRRLAAPNPNWLSYPDHGRAMEALLRTRTIWRYLVAGKSYGRIPRRMAIAAILTT